MSLLSIVIAMIVCLFSQFRANGQVTMANGLVVTTGGMSISNTLTVATNLQVATSDMIVTAGSTSVIATGSNPAAFVSATHASYAGNLIQATLDASVGASGNALSLLEGNNNLLRV